MNNNLPIFHGDDYETMIILTMMTIVVMRLIITVRIMVIMDHENQAALVWRGTDDVFCGGSVIRYSIVCLSLQI